MWLLKTMAEHGCDCHPCNRLPRGIFPVRRLSNIDSVDYQPMEALMAYLAAGFIPPGRQSSLNPACWFSLTGLGNVP